MVAKPGLLLKKNKSQINTWERKVLRSIFGPVNDRRIRRIRSNKELADLYHETDLATVIKTLELNGWDTSVRWKNREIPKRL
jgi:hypothetical protein